jgi:hypothetical protein
MENNHFNWKTPHIVPPDGLNFFIFSRRYVRDTVCNSAFFCSTISGPFSHNLDRNIGPKSRFFELFSVFFWLYSTGIISQNII